MMRRIAREARTAVADPIELGPVVPPSPAPAIAVGASVESNRDPAALSARLSHALVALLGQELRLAPEHIRELVEHELQRVRLARRIQLCVHPADLALIESPETLRERGVLRGSLTLTADPAIERGGCLLRTDLGEIDARLETRLALALALLRSGAL